MKETIYSYIGNKIVFYRTLKGLTQLELAKKLNVSRVSLIYYEKNQQMTPVHLLYKIAKVLTISIYDLIPSEKELKKIFKELKTNIKMEKELTEYFKKTK